MADPHARSDDAAEDERLYDAYLRAALAGEAEDPVAFLARHPGASPPLRARIAALHDAASSPPPDESPRPDDIEDGLPFERLGEYRLIRRVGAGGMGMVFEAEQTSVGRRVALKVLRPDLRHSPEALERFRREARLVATLEHPGIVRVLSAGEDGGVLYLAMELVRGRGLDEILEGASRTGDAIAPRRVFRWGAKLARAIEHANSKGVVHRDVKPSNVLVTSDDAPLLVDFGVARLDTGELPTLTGPFVGSPLYAAPEQLSGATVDGRADVYSLGVTLYEALTGAQPFEGATVDRVIHRVLNEDPPPPRRLNPFLSGDVDVVIRTAMEKDANRRYASAGALADDLEALLASRPISARPPGPLRRTAQWGRRHPALAAAAATTVLAVFGGLVAVGVQSRNARMAAARDAVAAVTDARERLVEFREERAAAEALERELHSLGNSLESRWVEPAEERELGRKERELTTSRRHRQALFYEVLALLRKAERLDPAVAATNTVRAELYAEKWRAALDAGDAEEASFYAGLVRETEPTGPSAVSVLGHAAFSLVSDPPGAEVHLFRYAECADDGARLAPVPLRDRQEPDGRWALRVEIPPEGLERGDHILSLAGHPVARLALVVEGAGDVRRGDRLVQIDGREVLDAHDEEYLPEKDAEDGVREYSFRGGGRSTRVSARALSQTGVRVAAPDVAAAAGGFTADVVREGESITIQLPPGGRYRLTAAPLLTGPDALIGVTPIRSLALESGAYVALLRLPGHADQRIFFGALAGQELGRTVTLPRNDSRPTGFVHVPPRSGVAASASCWMQERELTCTEYLEFLNDPGTLAEIDDATHPIRFPRTQDTLAQGGYWARGADGRYRIADDWRPDWPILGVSHADAIAYCEWRTARARRDGSPWRFRLPTLDQFAAAAGDFQRAYVFGHRFRPKWVKSCFSRPRASPEPVLRFPVDESPLGVFDLAGGVAEWCDAWYDPGRGLRRANGGSWATGDPSGFEIWGATGWSPDTALGTTGFRLVAVGERR